ncbi:hypothetical protein G6011_03766 [Alternaria panax]|uniref:DJ-1/PfpI domain-containing protein n=1 Tax=Alternaria panax TaxID=48097 RepID=A0AAD4NRL5_9PLEO|nr:hypothetical protein G6011_03766 [Alternaria panax]
MPAHPLSTKIGVVILPGFQLLDWAGPLDAFNILSINHTLTLCTIAYTLDPVPTQNLVQDKQGSQFSQSMIPTHTFENVLDGLEALLLPGGLGARGPGSDAWMKPQVEYLKGLDLSGKGSIKWILAVCTGSEILARTGLLHGRRATTNKRAFNHVKAQHPNIEWIAKACWVVDGNIWTSSSISAGMDLAFAWMAEVFGEETAQFVADQTV